MKKVVAVLAVAFLMTLLSGCVVQSAPVKAGNTVTMGVNNYSSGDTITIKVGQTVTFVTESSGTTHILVIGTNGGPASEDGAPDFGKTGIQVDPGKSWVSPPWTKAGTYHVTCVVHPTMNLTVTVTG